MIGSDQPLLFRQKLLFLYQNAKSLAPWPLICVTLTAVAWLWGLTTIDREQAEIRKHAYVSASVQARSYAEQVDRNIGQLDYIVRSLQFNWQKNGGALNLEEQAYAGLVPKAAKITVTIFDQMGMLVTSTISGEYHRQSVASMDYFQSHATNPDQELHISKPTRSILTGRDIVLLSRRLETDESAFAGVIVLAIEPLYLGSFVDETKLGPDDFVFIRRSDGAFFAAKTANGFHSQTPILKGSPALNGPSGVRQVSGDSYTDGKARIVAWHTAASYPIILFVGTSDAALLEAYQSRYRELWLGTAISSLLLLLLAGVGTWRAALRIWRSQYRREVHESYRVATENAKEGFYMLRPRYGPGNVIVDFVIEDCNERGAMYRGLPKESLVGQTVSQILPILFASHMLPQCRTAMETGIFEDEMMVPERGARPTQWLQRRLVRTAAGLALTLRDVTESKKQDIALVQLANADAVTSLPNRHWLVNYLPTAVDNARFTGKMLAVMFVDLDDFKNINDTLGHATGDQLLKAAALRLQGVIRPEDKIARLGGDEFTIIVEAAQTRDDVVAVAERIIETLRTPFVLGEGSRQHAVHASVGISLFPQNGADGETLLKHADIAMYDAKQCAKGTYRFFEPSLERQLVTRLTREAELKLAIERRELVLHYQPRVKGDTGEITSMEALVRWLHPVLGLVPPNDFIPMAEKTGLIVPLGAEVVRMACEQLAQWKERELSVVPVSVNVSAQQVDTGTVSAMLAAALKANGLHAGLLEVEVTESATVTKDGGAVAELAAIQKSGIKLYVDDFGTGYSCLAQLKDLDMDGLKIDRAFTSRLGKSRTDAALFQAIVSMAHALEMRVVAEGVETAEQLAAVQALGCEEVQGYYISKPVPAAETVLLLQKRFLFPAA
nr:EAL domain-containing protein [uncultured Noviherbaspirillum sp.]